jgi:diguanylate cyclase (GGDEF)-like protein
VTAILLLVLAKLSPLLALAVLLLGGTLLAMRRKLQRLSREASHDPLTGLPNRRGLADIWANGRSGKTLLFIDLDGFKAVNDTWGHTVGDALLQQVATRLASVVQPPGMLARWGGDEFVAVVPVDRLAVQQALLASAAIMGYDLSPAGGPASVRVGVSAGASAGEADLAAAIASANASLMQARSARV